MLLYLKNALIGLPVSLGLTISSILVSFSLSILFTIIVSLKIRTLSQLVKIYIILFTGTPLLVQIFIIYYGIKQFIILQSITWIWSLFSQSWICALVALSLNSAAYSTQIFIGAIQSVPKEQWQSCVVLGMNKFQSLKLLMPFAIKRSISSYSNEITMIFKSTSLAYTFTLMDIMKDINLLYSNTYDMKTLVYTGIVYFCVNGSFLFLMRCVERHALRFEQHN